ncbi:hypothetical protein V8C86DRAFT_529934 [Haematococcus lacustris]
MQHRRCLPPPPPLDWRTPLGYQRAGSGEPGLSSRAGSWLACQCPEPLAGLRMQGWKTVPARPSHPLPPVIAAGGGDQGQVSHPGAPCPCPAPSLAHSPVPPPALHPSCLAPLPSYRAPALCHRHARYLPPCPHHDHGLCRSPHGRGPVRHAGRHAHGPCPGLEVRGPGQQVVPHGHGPCGRCGQPSGAGRGRARLMVDWIGSGQGQPQAHSGAGPGPGS